LAANLGNHSLAFSKYFDHVHAFEPNIKTYQLLCYNAALAENITAYNIGASDQNAVFKSLQVEGNQGANSIVLEPDNRTGYLELDCRIIDEYLSADLLGKVGFIKIDVEGHELQALRGMVNILEQSSPLIAFELLKGAIVSGTSPVIDFLRDNGYNNLFELYKVSPVSVAVRPLSSLQVKNYKMLVASK
jgi:FkbM family methyltransferase